MINHYFMISKCQALVLRNFCGKIFRDFCVIHEIMKIFDDENLELYDSSERLESLCVYSRLLCKVCLS